MQGRAGFRFDGFAQALVAVVDVTAGGSGIHAGRIGAAAGDRIAEG